MKDTASKLEPAAGCAVILSRNVTIDNCDSYKEKTGWDFIVVRSALAAAAEILAAGRAVLAYDGSASPPSELLALAVERRAAVVPVRPGGDPYEAAATAIAARARREVQTMAEPPADGPRKTAKRQADDVKMDRAALDAAQSATRRAGRRTEPAHDGEQRPTPPTEAPRPVRRQQKIFTDAPDPGELLSAEEIKALLGGPDGGEMEDD